MIKVIIADDEVPARKRLRKLLQECAHAESIEIIGEASDGVQALELLSSRQADIVFLDIQMPGHDGFEVLDRLPPDRRPVVVFVTAFDEYAIRAFDANAVDYLLKPISSQRLDDAIGRAKKLIGTNTLQSERIARLLDYFDAQAISDATESVEKAQYLKKLSIPYRDRILIIPIERIISVEISEGITRVHILEEDSTSLRPRIRQHIVSYTLDQLGSLLPPDAFMRIHRSAIVQFAHIKELIPWFSGRYKLLMSGGHEVIASRERSKVLKERLMV